jgi:phage terminase large subunit
MNTPPLDWQRPDYAPIYAVRAERLARIRAHPEALPTLRACYAERVPAFINDWGGTSGPRDRDFLFC